ncbi:MAG: efflux RND transporter periplasmic adaptor subunit [Lachnospiraceae bacterium]|nr:efflux RND transporter periplasmic adaptor subunit [Lachnospiraceae bacterium]
MKNFFGKKKNVIIVIVIVALICAGVGGYFYYDYAQYSDEEVYVSSVSSITGVSANGLNNRYAGVVEAQESWTASLDGSLSVKETYVEVGQSVEEGQELFSYDMSEVESSIRSAKLELERLNNELTAMQDDINELSAERDAATDETAKAEYTVEIQQAQLDLSSKKYDITSKNEEISSLQEKLSSATVTSKIAGVVKSIASDSEDALLSDSSGYITIVNMSAFQIRGSVNEQNISALSNDAAVIVYSRTDANQYWKGKITNVDTGSASSNSSYGEEDSDTLTSSSNYSFYVSLEESEGLNMGQHVYIELDQGQLDEKSDALYLEEYYIDLTDEENPVVWVDDNGHLKKQSVTLGEYDENLMKYEVTKGLELSDLIAMPYDGIKEGMKTVNTEEEDSESDELEDTEDSEDVGDSEEDDDTSEDTDLSGSEDIGTLDGSNTTQDIDVDNMTNEEILEMIQGN